MVLGALVLVVVIVVLGALLVVVVVVVLGALVLVVVIVVLSALLVVVYTLLVVTAEVIGLHVTPITRPTTTQMDFSNIMLIKDTKDAKDIEYGRVGFRMKG